MLSSDNKTKNRRSGFFDHFKKDAAFASSLDNSVPDVMPSGLFREELEREMLRADRHDTPLTLLIFSIYTFSGKLIQEESDLVRLAESLSQCTRRTDLKGWFSDNQGYHVGLMLHNTPFDRAERILACVRERFVLSMQESKNPRQPESHVHCEIYAYPVSSPSLGDRYQQLYLFDDETLLDMQGSEEEVGEGVETASSMTNSEEEKRQIRSIEELLVIPLPWWKRSMDIFISSSALLLLSPLLLTVAALVKMTSPGSVIFKQQRVGQLGKIFWLWKFRSMRANADPSVHKQYLSQLINGAKGSSEKPMQKLDKHNPQITPLGRIMRLTCIDELPQLVNVLRGDMSLVGPRPCLPYEAKEYLLWHHRRFDTIPGLTGLWQVSGKNKTTFRQMIRLDIQYITHLSFWMDMKILLKTIPTVIAQIREETEVKKPSSKTVMEMDQA